MTTRTELIQHLQRASQGTPFLVTPTPAGFRVEHNFADVQWRGLMGRGSIGKTFTIDATLDDATQTMVQSDTLREVQWGLGPDGTAMPRFSAAASVQKGAVYSKQFGTAATPTMSGGLSGGSWSFSSSEMKDWLAATAGQVGWSRSKKLDTNAKIGLWVAGLTVAALLIVGLLVMLRVLG